MSKKVLLALCLTFPMVTTSWAAQVDDLARMVRAQGDLLTRYQQQLIELQQDVDNLRGQVQELNYRLQQNQQPVNSVAPEPKSAVVPSPARSSAETLAGWQPSGNVKNDYNFIIKFVLAGKQSSNAIKALQQFVQKYPNSSYNANANYWLGQLNYGQGKTKDASYYFATVVKSYPNSGKAAESLYKIGVILLEQGQSAKAKAVFEQVVSKYASQQTVANMARKKLAGL